MPWVYLNNVTSGNSLAALDFTNRIGAVHHSYQAGGHWERVLFIESMNFALSAVGTAVVKAGMAFLLAVPP